jgi:hypothetical protein
MKERNFRCAEFAGDGECVVAGEGGRRTRGSGGLRASGSKYGGKEHKERDGEEGSGTVATEMWELGMGKNVWDRGWKFSGEKDRGDFRKKASAQLFTGRRE